jgi:DNA ligase (NAD+)
MDKLKSNPEQYALKAPISNLEKVLTLASQKYYSDEEPIISDQVYDIILEVLQSRDPNNKIINNIGYKSSNDKIKLPYFMGSMNKIKTKDGVKTWLTKFDSSSKFVISDKLDGISALYSNNKLYTRGNGEYGRDISGLLKYLNIPKIENVVLRGELIISKQNFEKNRGVYTSARSMVNGLIALKCGNDLLSILDFVIFEVIEPKVAPYDQLVYANQVGFKVPNYIMVDYGDIIQWKSDEDNFLKKTLNKFKVESNYDIDGIIVTHNILYPRTIGNPKNSIAFKSNDYGKVTKVVDIEWSVSKYGILIPRIRFEKVDLGSIVEYCTGFSGKFIFNNCLGPGSNIRVILSGDVIPYIVEIISSTYPKMPNVGYEWTKNKLHCILLEDDSELSKKKIVHFIKTIKIDYLSSGIISNLYDNGYTTISSILSIKKEEMLKIDGFKETLSTKLIGAIHDIISKPIYLGLLMVASLEFNSGYGLKRVKKILDKYPCIMEDGITLDQLINIDGFQVKTAKQFMDNFEGFKIFLSKLDLEYYVKTDESLVEKNSNIDGKNFVITGFRDASIIEYITKNGGTLQNDVNMKTDYLIVKDSDSQSSKIKKAEIMGVDIILKDDFSKFCVK